MRKSGHGSRPSRVGAAAAGVALALALVGATGAFAAEAQPSLHRQATAALADLQAAVGELTRASALTANDAGPYKTAMQRAINAVAGANDESYEAKAGNPGDAQGALGHLTSLAGEAGQAPWAGAVQGAVVNATVAESRLLDALKSDDIDEFQLTMSAALEALDVAIGRDSDAATLGGLQGALATTVLGVPDGARTVPGCSAPTAAPAYGVSGGYLLYVAVPAGETALPQSEGIGRVSVHDDIVVLHTAAAALAGKLCAHRASNAMAVASVAAKSAANSAVKSAAKSAAKSADPPAGGARALYTEVQAQAGKQVAMGICAACHGKDLQGGSAPAIAGTAFLKKGKALDWTVGNLRTIVTTTMPRNNPGSLKPQQYADVLAYLLAVNCFPAGHSPFPTHATSALRHAAFAPKSAGKADNGDIGTCTLHQHAQTTAGKG